MEVEEEEKGDEEVVGCCAVHRMEGEKRGEGAREGVLASFRHARPLMLISQSRWAVSSAITPFPPAFPGSLYRELVPRMRNCLKLLAPPS